MSALTPEIRQKIKDLDMQGRRLARSSSFGDARSQVKGFGIDFDQIREYQQGDDIRFIDWKSSAKMNQVLVKQYLEERSHTVIIALDTSASTLFSSGTQTGFERMREAAALLIFVAGYRGHKVSFVSFAQTITTFIPPRRGLSHMRALIDALFSQVPAERSATSIEQLLRDGRLRRQKQAILFLISDFIEDGVGKALAAFSAIAEVLAIRMLDPVEQQFPNVGFLTLQDPETGEQITINARQAVSAALQARVEQQTALFKKYGIEAVTLSPAVSCIEPLAAFLRRRLLLQ